MNKRKAPLCLQNSPYSLNEKWFIQPVFSVLTLLVQRQSFSKHFFTSFYLKVVVILSTPVFRGTYFSRFHKKIAHWKSVNKDFLQISRKWNFVPWLLIIYKCKLLDVFDEHLNSSMSRKLPSPVGKSDSFF